MYSVAAVASSPHQSSLPAKRVPEWMRDLLQKKRTEETAAGDDDEERTNAS